jgi:hypothetical protein
MVPTVDYSGRRLCNSAGWILPTMQDTDDFNEMRQRVVVIDDVLRDPNAAAAGKEIVAWLPYQRVLAERLERLQDPRPIDRNLVFTPGLVGV